MKDLSKVVWAEGVFLGQQHFQAWDRNLEASQQLRSKALHPFAWGVLSCSVDEKALENGRFRLQACQVIFADGRLASYDAAENPTLACELSSGGGQTVEIYLGLPANQQVEGISGYPGRNQLCAWQADYRQLSDEYDSSREREVLLARPNLTLLSGSEGREQFATLKIAELVNQGDGSYRLVPEYVPPLVRIGASPYLKALLGRMLEGVGGRLRVLNDRRIHFSGGPAEFARTDPGQFLLLQSLSAIYPQLLHLQQTPDLHPEILYRVLCQTIGGLCAFHPELDPTAIPRYQHGELTTVFRTFERLLAEVLNLSMGSRSSALQLAKESDCLLAAHDIDHQTLQQLTLFLEVLHVADDPVWITDFARQVKVASRGTIEMTVASALPGIRTVHTQRPPNKLSTKSGYEYFRLEPRGDVWNRVLEERSLALFLPQAFVSATINLVSVKE